MNQQVQPNIITPTATLTPDAIMQLGFAFWGSKTLLSAIELGLFTLLADGPMSAEALTTQLKLHPRSVRDFLEGVGSQIRTRREVEAVVVERLAAV